MRRALVALLISSVSAMASISYQVTENASTCSEIHIPSWTPPAQIPLPGWPINSWGCEYDVRAKGPVLYLGLSCGSVDYWRMDEKYAVDLRHPEQIRQIDQATWDAASVLEPSIDGVWSRSQHQAGKAALKFAGSGPKYAGAAPSPGGSRIAVNSWSGVVRDPPQIFDFEAHEGSTLGFIWDLIRAHYDGHYWIDIYDTASSHRLIQIRGEFHGDSPVYFQGKAKWLNGRYFLLPIAPRDMRRLLICDVDAAAAISGTAATDAPVSLARAKPFLQHTRSLYQLRYIEPRTPQAHVTGFQDAPLLDPATKLIQAVDVSASVDVQVPGEYSLELDLSGIQERAVSTLAVGTGQITVRFPINRLRELGVPGPYEIRWAQLLRLVDDGQIVADNSAVRGARSHLLVRNYATQAYSLASLGFSLYFTGDNSAVLIPATSSQPERLQVRIGIFSPKQNCRGSGFLARARMVGDNMVTGQPGRRALVLNFTGAGISEPAPYLIEQISVQCGNDYVRSQGIYIDAK